MIVELVVDVLAKERVAGAITTELVARLSAARVAAPFLSVSVDIAGEHRFRCPCCCYCCCSDIVDVDVDYIGC